MAELSRWNFDRYVRRPGDKRFEMHAVPQVPTPTKNAMSADPYWIVEGSFGDENTSRGAVSYEHCASLEEAQAQLAECASGSRDERDKRYTDWVIVEYTPMIIGRVVHREPVRNPTNEES